MQDCKTLELNSTVGLEFSVNKFEEELCHVSLSFDFSMEIPQLE